MNRSTRWAKQDIYHKYNFNLIELNETDAGNKKNKGQILDAFSSDSQTHTPTDSHFPSPILPAKLLKVGVQSY
ncbi:MAG: hypothetical protein HQ559_13905 [Lentisphaerae bacterium]|nr:hypothetical protein [Lentisphaerota bacterium]